MERNGVAGDLTRPARSPGGSDAAAAAAAAATAAACRAAAAAAAAAVRLELLGVAVGLLGVGQRLGGLLLGALAELATAAAVVVVVVVGGGCGAVEHARHDHADARNEMARGLRLRLHRSRLVGGVS